MNQEAAANHYAGQVQNEHGRAATAAGPNGPTQQNPDGNNKQQNQSGNNGNNAINGHNGVPSADAAVASTPVEPRVLFMGSGMSTHSPSLPRRRSRSRAPPTVGTPDEQASGPPRITPPIGAPQANNSPVAAGNSRRALAMEGAIQAATVESNRYAKEKADELKGILEGYIPKAMGDIEAKINQRIDKIEKCLEFLHTAKPGEDEAKYTPNNLAR